MKFKTKVIVIVLTLLIGMLGFPILAVWVLKGDGGMGFSFIQFFAINPLICASLSILAGTEIKRLWFLPFVIAVIFPFSFSLAVSEMVWELFIYSVIYLVIGYIMMLITYLIKRFAIKN